MSDVEERMAELDRRLSAVELALAADAASRLIPDGKPSLRRLGLTRSQVNQLPRANWQLLTDAVPQGYLLNVRKEMPRAIVLQHPDGHYSVLESDWQLGSRSFYRKVGRWSQSMKFASEEATAELWQIYQRIKRQADEQGQLFV